jgi:hypothetical protein
MSAGVSQRTTRYGLLGAAVLVYFSRPWSCELALSQFNPENPVSYSHFDYHGWGVIFAWLAALLFAVPVLWLASKVFLRGSGKLGVFGRARHTKATLVSVAIALGLGAPMHSQLSYLIGLPISITTPVLISSLAWLLVVEMGRTAAVEGDLLDKGAVRVAGAVALLVTVPKLALIGYDLLQT